MKNLGITIFLIGVFVSGAPIFGYATSVVINELYYDHPSDDSNHEFIELYNNGTSAIDISGWKIEWGGSFGYGSYEIPANTIIYGLDYFLIGGAETFNDFGVTPDLTNEFSFQNGGSKTDGVRIWDTASYYDTVLYDSPNNSNLPKRDWLDTAFAPDVSAGRSLVRVSTGVDTNHFSDWKSCFSPNPTASTAPIPEPSTLILLGGGLIGLAGVWYRRKRTQK